jgi:methionine synthase II (cobalamin-independent)
LHRTTPPFRADHVGSLLRPTALKEARAKRERGEIGADDLKAIEDREIKEVIRKQEAVGLKSITDGEFRRASWRTDFLERLAGVESYQGDNKIKFQGAQPGSALLRVKEKLGGYAPHPMIEHFRFVKQNTEQTAKMTIPSPSSLHFRYGREAVPEAIYPAMEDFYRDLGQSYGKVVRAFADAGCRYLQIDEVNLAYLCDPTLRRSRHAADDLCRHDQRRDGEYSVRHDHQHASVPRQFPLQLRGQRRLRSDRGNPVQQHQRARLFHGIRHRARRRLRAAALRAEGKSRGARPGDVEDRTAGSA